jgi:two-component system, NarL family, response regulator NreC
MTTIVLADDHHVVRQGLRALLESEPEISIVGEAADGLEAADLVERFKPDVLVVDLVMPGLGGLEVTRQVGRRSPRTRVVVLSMHANEGYVLEALRNGATAYVLKQCTATELVRAVREAAVGRRYLSPPLSERAIEAYLRRAEATDLDPYETLTSREREVLHLAAEGLSNPDIASRLYVSPRTVEVHRGNLMRKLGLHNQAELIRYAIRRGIVPLEG